jgi:predicted negative regulator of RcsB-dependent stress response
MANHLDLEEQEQLEQLKAFWGQYGNAITWGLVLIFAVFAGWNGFQYWQRHQSAQASAMYDEVERMVAAGDIAKMQRAFEEMKNRYPSTVYAQQAALLLAKAGVQANKTDEAKTALRWASEQGKDSALAVVARLRLATVLMDATEFDEAIKVLQSDPIDPEYLAVVQDRRSDVYAAKGDKAAAIESYKKAFASSAAKPELQRLVRIKLNALGVDMEPAPVSPSATGSQN